ncbi:unnamed protein product [Polarella glacialis]|uniref:Uncharacterized protein n=1 Tax=Polarella glacialis TaxID=89957 RepID=A0A813JA96_POLGL|nr:unnamed protein product [Polarella glacialis]
MHLSEFEVCHAEVAQQELLLRQLWADRAERDAASATGCREELPALLAATAAARAELQDCESFARAQENELQACERELVSLQIGHQELRARLSMAEDAAMLWTGTPAASEVQQEALLAELREAETGCHEAAQAWHSLEASADSRLKVLQGETESRRAEALAPLREKVSALLSELCHAEHAPSTLEASVSAELLSERLCSASEHASRLAKHRLDLEQACVAWRSKRLAAQRQVLTLSDQVAQADQGRRALATEVRECRAKDALQAGAMGSALHGLSQRLGQLRESLAHERQCWADSAALSSQTAAEQGQRLEQQCSSQLQHKLQNASQHCEDWLSRNMQTTGAKLESLEISWKQLLASEELWSTSELGAAQAEAETTTAAMVAEETRLQLAAQLLSDQLSAAQADSLRSQREQQWLSVQLQELRQVEGELRLQDTELRESELPHLEGQLRAQNFELQELLQDVSDGSSGAATRRDRLLAELHETRAETAEALYREAASWLDSNAAALAAEAAAAVNFRPFCGIGGAGISGTGAFASGGSPWRPRPSGPEVDVDELLFSGDEGIISVPPTPSDLSPTAGERAKFGGTMDSLGLQGLADLAGGPQVFDPDAFTFREAQGESTGIKPPTADELELKALRSQLCAERSEADRARRPAEAAIARALQLRSQLGAAGPGRVASTSRTLDARLSELEAEVLRLRGERGRLMDRNNGLRSQLGSEISEDPVSQSQLPERGPTGPPRVPLEELNAALRRLTDQNRALRQELAILKPTESPTSGDVAASSADVGLAAGVSPGFGLVRSRLSSAQQKRQERQRPARA